MTSPSQKPALWTFVRRWLWPVYNPACNATSPENERCILPLGHDGSHVPHKGRGWAWG